MWASFEQLLGEAASQYVAQEAARYQKQPPVSIAVTLSAVDKNRLAHKIALLPYQEQSILFCRYCFGCGPQETQRTLELDNVAGRLAVLRLSLSAAVGVPAGMVADDDSMQPACRLALQRYRCDFEDEAAAAPTPISKPMTKPTISLIKRLTKAAAVAAAVVVMIFSTAMVANAELRQEVIDWLAATFPQFSVFWPDAAQSEATATPRNLVVGHLPNGYALADILVDDTIAAHYYTNAAGEDIRIVITTNFAMYFDTEKAAMHEFVLKGDQAYRWKTDGAVNIIWQQDGLQCHLVATVTLEETLKIAENVVLQKK